MFHIMHNHNQSFHNMFSWKSIKWRYETTLDTICLVTTLRSLRKNFIQLSALHAHTRHVRNYNMNMHEALWSDISVPALDRILCTRSLEISSYLATVKILFRNWSQSLVIWAVKLLLVLIISNCCSNYNVCKHVSNYCCIQ